MADDSDNAKSSTKGLHNDGLAKPFTNALRTGSRVLDFIPIPVLDDLGAAGLALLAAGIDAGCCLLKGDKKGAMREAVVGAVDAGVTAVPFLQYGQFVGLDARGMARDMAHKAMDSFNNASGAKTYRAPAPHGMSAAPA